MGNLTPGKKNVQPVRSVLLRDSEQREERRLHSDRRDSYRKERAPPVLYTNRLSSTLSADGLSRCRGSIDRTSSFSSRDEVFEEENKYWSLKIKELESYDGWDKQYILGRGENAK